LTPAAGALSLGSVVLAADDRVAIVVGTEGGGLTPEVIEACDAAVQIPMSAGVDSLNVATAAGIAFWELRPR
jgi:tRNA G18 (ribose-2'-O)-methylase SpoU